jgi:hypothetical protein
LAVSQVVPGCRLYRVPNAHWAVTVWISAATLFLTYANFSQTAWGSQAASSAHPAENAENPVELVREVMHNEIEAQLQDTSLWCFREEHQDDGKPERSLEVCQTEGGDIERTLAVNGRELSSEEKEAEEKRVEKLIEHPEQLRVKQKKQRDDAEQARKLMEIFPDALRFEDRGREGDVLKLSFHPNPNFHPATRPAMVLHHLQGTLLVDAKRKRLLEVHGLLPSEVKFGAGILGHLDPGGTFMVKQGEVAAGHWDVLRMDIHMSGKALFFKTISVQQKERYRNYVRVPDGTTLQQAAELLKRKCDSVDTAAVSSGFQSEN